MRKLLRSVTLGITTIAALGASFAGLQLLGLSPAQASTDDFSYDSWHVEYTLSTDEAGRALAHVTETVAPRFPETDQNKGIVRGIPTSYRGTSTDPRDFSVVDENGEPVPFELESDGQFEVVLVGDETYLHGLKHFVISYTLSDVVQQPDDAEAQEFYWDVMDFEHKQPVQQFSGSFVFEGDLATKLNGNTSCYLGAAESKNTCDLTGTGTQADPLTIAPVALNPQEGVTVAVGLAADAVVQPAGRLPNFALDGLPLIVSSIGLAAGGIGTVAVGRERRKRRSFRGTAVAQYDVPANLPPLIAGPVVGGSLGDAAASEIVHLAVTGVTQLEDEPSRKGKGKPKPLVRLRDPERVGDPLDRLALKKLMPGAKPGDVVKIPRKSTSFAESMSELLVAGGEAASDRGYFEKIAVPMARVFGWIGLVIALGAGAFAVVSFALRDGGEAVIAGLLALVALVASIWALSKHRVHTPLGAETREYLEGVRLFISVAEADRIKMLQSPEGAERRAAAGIESAEGLEVIHLYERLLPYAMLFNQEKEWGKVLEVRYEAEPGYLPYWYPGVAAHGAGAVPAALASYTSALTSAVSYTESSSSGSTGGGFAGGGGGGGFSGGR